MFETLCFALAALYIGLFIQSANDPYIFNQAPFWFTYALLASAFNIAWAFEVRSHWSTVFGSVARCVITGEAIVMMLAGSHQRLWRCLCLGLGVAVWLLLQFGGLSWLGRVRLGAFAGLCITIGLCVRLWNRHRVNTAALLHGGLLAVWSLTAVLASAVGSRRRDAADLGALVVQGVTLFAWVWLGNNWERFERA